MTKIIIALVYGFIFSTVQQLAEGNGCHPIQKNLGEPFDFVCPEFHKGKSSFYHYNLTAEQYQLVYNGSHRFRTTIETLDNAGEYCCTKHRGDTLPVNRSHCCIRVEVPTTMQWNLSENAPFNGNISGSCTVTSNPAPTGDLLYIHNCQYQSFITGVDKYTVRVNFIIYNAVQSCHIHCHTAAHAEERTLTIRSRTVATTNLTNNSSLPSENSSASTTTPNPNITSNQETSNNTISTDLRSSYTDVSTTEQRFEENTPTDADSNKRQTDATTDPLKIILILLVVIVLIILIMTSVTLLLVIWIIWISMRGIKRNVTIT